MKNHIECFMGKLVKPLINLIIINICLPMFSEVNCSLIPFVENNRYGMKDCNGNLVLKPVFNMCYFDSNNEYFRVISDSGYGVVNTKGDFVIHPKTNMMIGPIDRDNDGYFMVYDSKTMLKGIVNLREQSILPMVHEHITYLGGDCFIAKRNGLFHFINTKLNIKRQMNIDGIRPMYQNEFRFNRFNKVRIRTGSFKYICMDQMGREIEFKQFELVNIHPENGDYIVKGPKGIGVLDSNMNKLLPAIHKEIMIFNREYYKVKLNHSYNLLNRNNLGPAFKWQKHPIYRLNDSLISKGSKKAKNVYNFNSPDKKLLKSDYKDIEIIEYNDSAYFLCQTKDSSFLFLDHDLIFKTSGTIIPLSNFYFVTETGRFIDIYGNTKMELNVELFEITGMIDQHIVEINKDNEYIYINLKNSKVISQFAETASE